MVTNIKFIEMQGEGFQSIGNASINFTNLGTCFINGINKYDSNTNTAEGTINYNANIVEFTATDVASNKETVIKKIATETTKKQEPTQKLEKVQINETKNASELDDSPKTDDYTNASTWIISAGVAFIIAITSLVIGSSKRKY